MKKLVVLSMALCALNASAKMGSNDKVKYAGDTAYSGFCEAIVKDDLDLLKRNLRRKIGIVGPNKQSVLERLVADGGMLCNGVGLVSFSEQRKASEVLGYLSKNQ